MKKLYLIFLLGGYAGWSLAQSPSRALDPVVIKGADAPCVAGLPPADLVGFRYDGNSWVQIPIQIDEVVVKDISAPYGPSLWFSILDQQCRHRQHEPFIYLLSL